MAVAEAVKGVSLRLTPRPRRPVNQGAHHVHPSWTAFAPPRFPTCAGNAGLMPTLLLRMARSGSPASHLEPGMYQSIFPHPSVLVNFQTSLSDYVEASLMVQYRNNVYSHTVFK